MRYDNLHVRILLSGVYVEICGEERFDLVSGVPVASSEILTLT